MGEAGQERAKVVALACLLLAGCNLPKPPLWECRLKDGQTIYVRHASNPSQWRYGVTDTAGWSRRADDFYTCRIKETSDAR